jgi:BioD-like phosphotransacetylase family protein
MRTVLVTSTRPYSGKSGICLALIRELEARGRDVGYFKPFGTMPVQVEGVGITDQDAFYINGGLKRPAPIEVVCPAVKTRDLLESCMDSTQRDLRPRVAEAFAAVSEGRDVIIAEGPSDVFQGLTVELSTCQLATLLEAKVLLIDRPERIDFPDEVLGAADCLREHLAGVLFNRVDETQTEFIREHVTRFVEARGIPVFGALPVDAGLASITVGEIVEALGGTVLSAEERLDVTVESFMIGAMGQDKALRFFRRKARKAVITGGDRADVQLAALETKTSCLILTGNFPPSSIVLSRAEELGVPMVLVDMDTLTAVERMENLLGKMRVHDPAKAARIRELLVENADLPGLFAAFGID